MQDSLASLRRRAGSFARRELEGAYRDADQENDSAWEITSSDGLTDEAENLGPFSVERVAFE